MKASDISDESMLAAITRDMDERDMHTLGACTWTIAEREGWPKKVVGAKLQQMVKRGILQGCNCGCRGDWLIL